VSSWDAVLRGVVDVEFTALRESRLAGTRRSLTVSRAWIAFTFSFALVAMPTVVVVIVRGVATTVKIYEVRAKSWWGSKLNLFWARRGRRVAVVRR
jgi:hypothetical protein